MLCLALTPDGPKRAAGFSSFVSGLHSIGAWFGLKTRQNTGQSKYQHKSFLAEHALVNTGRGVYANGQSNSEARQRN